MPLCELFDIQIPESASTGESIMLGAAVLNRGEAGDCYVKVTNLNTGEIYGSEAFLQSETSRGLFRFVTMPASNLRLRIEVGEGFYLNPVNVQDSADFTIINPEAPPPTPPVFKPWAMMLGLVVVGAIVVGSTVFGKSARA